MLVFAPLYRQACCAAVRGGQQETVPTGFLHLPSARDSCPWTRNEPPWFANALRSCHGYERYGFVLLCAYSLIRLRVINTCGPPNLVGHAAAVID